MIPLQRCDGSQMTLAAGEFEGSCGGLKSLQCVYKPAPPNRWASIGTISILVSKPKVGKSSLFPRQLSHQ
jgi:hypothetical protein